LQSIKEELEKRITEIDYVELTNIAGKPADHLAVRTADTDFQIWLAQGEQPLPLRVVITYKKEVGQPQFRANLSDWNLAPKIDEAALAFSPPQGRKPSRSWSVCQPRSRRKSQEVTDEDPVPAWSKLFRCRAVLLHPRHGRLRRSPTWGRWPRRWRWR
jgi:hypothetical protein